MYNTHMQAAARKKPKTFVLLQGEKSQYTTKTANSQKETEFYYYGARYLDPKTSRWISVDPAMGEYVPGAPINAEVRKRNGNLPGMGGVFNVVNLHVYHYAGNNPVKYVDPDGRFFWWAWPLAQVLIGGGIGVLASVGIQIAEQLFFEGKSM